VPRKEKGLLIIEAMVVLFLLVVFFLNFEIFNQEKNYLYSVQRADDLVKVWNRLGFDKRGVEGMFDIQNGEKVEVEFRGERYVFGNFDGRERDVVVLEYELFDGENLDKLKIKIYN